MTVTVAVILQTYTALLAKRLTYDQADRWAWKLTQLEDDRQLIYKPPEDEELIWELISHLHGIDLPDPPDMTKPAANDQDVIDFLREKGFTEFN